MTGRWNKTHTTGDGLFYSQAELRLFVDYCADAGVRVYPEYDMPGHSGALLLANPQLNGLYVPSSPVEFWGVYFYVLNPSLDVVFDFVADLLEQSNGVFHDSVVHLGGDEVQWDRMWDALQNWKDRNQIADLQGYFSQQVRARVEATGKRLMGWEEVVRSSPLGNSSFVQWWKAVYTGLSAHSAVESHSFFLDSLQDAAHYWRGALSPSAFGAEGCVWSEWVADNLDTRVFPALLGLAETFWKGAAAVSELQESNFWPRVSVWDVGFSTVGVTNRAVFRTQVMAVASGNGTWNYSQAVQNINVYPANDPSYDAVYMICDVLAPTTRSVGPRIPLFRLIDIARPTSLHVVALGALCREALRQSLSATGEAPALLYSVLSQYAKLPAAVSQVSDPDVRRIADDLAAMAQSWLNWMSAVQSGADAEPLRKLALSTGSPFFLLEETNYNVQMTYNVTNLLWQVREILLVQNVTTPNSTIPAELTTTTTITSEAVATTTTKGTTTEDETTTTSTTAQISSTTVESTSFEATTTSFIASTTTIYSNSTSPSGLSRNAIAGVAAGLLLVSAAVVVTILVCKRLRKRRMERATKEYGGLVEEDVSMASSNEDLFEDL